MSRRDIKLTYFLVLYVPSVLLCTILLAVQIKGLTMSNHPDGLYGNLFKISFLLSLLILALSIARNSFSIIVGKQVYTDVTGTQSKQALEDKITVLDNKDSLYGTSVIMIDLNNLKHINDQYGHDKGDEIIASFARLLQRSADDKAFIARFGGDEFVSICENSSDDAVQTFIKKLSRAVTSYNETSLLHISFAYGYAVCTAEHYLTVHELIHLADQNMYANKKIIKNTAAAGITGIDTLTGLPGNETVFNHIKTIVNDSSPEQKIAIICSDISNFRFINDSFGYSCGDSLLKTFGKKIQESELVLFSSRIIGDTFITIIDTTKLEPQAVERIIQERNFAIAAEIQSLCDGCFFTINSGIYFIEHKKMAPAEILQYANVARKIARQNFSHTCIYSTEINQEEKKKAQILTSFRKSLAHNEFVFYLQPKIHLAENKVRGAEALSRWIHNDTILWMPDEYIPVLEESGDIIALDYFIYDQVFAWLAKRQADGKGYIEVSVNVSRIHLQRIDPFISYIQKMLDTYGVPSRYIIFELTESVYMQNEEHAQRLIFMLHAMNFRISMDDFGSGYSSLKALKNLSFDEIKIDREFVNGSLNVSEQIILEKVISMSKQMEKTVVCEGVESQYKVDFLREQKCDFVQGFFYSKPLPVHEFDKFCAEFTGSPSNDAISSKNEINF
jgi:c-di-GMP phosphodiesterase